MQIFHLMFAINFLESYLRLLHNFFNILQTLFFFFFSFQCSQNCYKIFSYFLQNIAKVPFFSFFLFVLFRSDTLPSCNFSKNWFLWKKYDKNGEFLFNTSDLRYSFFRFLIYLQRCSFLSFVFKFFWNFRLSSIFCAI